MQATRKTEYVVLILHMNALSVKLQLGVEGAARLAHWHAPHVVLRRSRSLNESTMPTCGSKLMNTLRRSQGYDTFPQKKTTDTLPRRHLHEAPGRKMTHSGRSEGNAIRTAQPRRDKPFL